MQAEELSYVIVTPYSMRKSRTGGIVSRLISRTGLDLVGGRMFAPGEELVRRYTEGIVSAKDPRHRATQELIRDYVRKNFTGERDGQRPRVLLLVFRGPGAIEKIRHVVGHIVHERTSGETIRDTYDVSGGNLLGRWSHFFSPSSDLKVQLYYDRTTRDTAIFKEDRDTFDFDLQHRFPLGERNDMVWGVGYRASADKEETNFSLTLDPDERTTHLFSTFIQDEITLVKDRLRLTVGSKFEHNDFTGFEIQPSGRLLWTLSHRQSVWASVSRAVRTPSRAQDDIRINQVTPFFGVLSSISGTRSFVSEKLMAYELGYRLQAHARVSFDLAAFYNDYDDLRTAEPVGLVPGAPAFFTFVLGNRLHGETYGVEFAPSWQATDWWRWQAAYSYLKMQLHRSAGSGDTASEMDEGRSPHHQFSLRSTMDLPYHVQFDSVVRYVDDLPTLNIGSYLTLDLRLGWRPTKNWELAIVGQNLLDDRHPEFSPSTIRTQATEVQRSVYGKITWHF